MVGKAVAKQKQMHQATLGSLKKQQLGDTPEVRLTQTGLQAPIMQDASLLQHLSAIYTGYDGGIADAEERVRGTTPQGVKRSQRRRTAAKQQDDSSDDEELARDLTLQPRTAEDSARHADVQSDATLYLKVLRDYTADVRLPSLLDILRLERIIRQSSLHDSVQPSQDAFRMLLQYIQRFPAVKLQHHGDGSPYAGLAYIEDREGAWSILQAPGRLTREHEEVPGVREPPQSDPHKVVLLSAGRFFGNLWQATLDAAQDIDSPDKLASNYGDVLMLQAVLAQLESDLMPRLAAFRATEGPAAACKAAAGETGALAAKRRANFTTERHRLLEESQLWRLMAAIDMESIDRQRLVTMLVTIIGLAADSPATASPALGALTTPQQLASLASFMLRMLLELYGTAEASGYYANAAGRIRKEDRRNQRISLDTYLQNSLFEAGSVLRTWEGKQALLMALRARDRLRLLGLVIANRRVQRNSDAGKYSSMQAARDFAEGIGDTPTYIDVDPVEVLTYIASDINFAQTACNKRADDLALVVAHTGRAAALFRPDAAEVAAAYKLVLDTMMGRHETANERKDRASQLSIKSRAELFGAARILEAAQASKSG